MVPGRGAYRPEEQDHTALGEARDTTIGAEGSADEIGLYLWRDLPEQGKAAGLVLPFCNTETMSLHLAEIWLAVAPGAHAVVLMDQAGWHMTGKLVVPGNISIVALPAKCPELGPGREHLAVHARQLALQPGLHLPTTISSTIAAKHGTSSSISLGAS